MSLPRATRTCPAATAAAEPPDEPPAIARGRGGSEWRGRPPRRTGGYESFPGHGPRLPEHAAPASSATGQRGRPSGTATHRSSAFPRRPARPSHRRVRRARSYVVRTAQPPSLDVGRVAADIGPGVDRVGVTRYPFARPANAATGRPSSSSDRAARSGADTARVGAAPRCSAPGTQVPGSRPSSRRRSCAKAPDTGAAKVHPTTAPPSTLPLVTHFRIHQTLRFAVNARLHLLRMRGHRTGDREQLPALRWFIREFQEDR